MKGWFNFGKFVGVTAAFASLATFQVQAGFIDLLRGEPAEPQRVAFIGAAQVKDLVGEVERLTGIDRWTRVQKGTQLKPGDIIRTTSGTVVLQMRESKSFVKVTPNTILRLLPEERSVVRQPSFASAR